MTRVPPASTSPESDPTPPSKTPLHPPPGATPADAPAPGASPSGSRGALLALVLCAALWALGGPLIKLLSRDADDLSGFTIAFYRSLFGGLFVLPLAWRGLGSLRADGLAWPVGSIVAFTVMTGAFVLATMKTTAANAILLQYTSPIWVFLLAPILLGERPRWREGWALTAALVGVLVIFLGQPAGDDDAGLWIALLAGLGYGVLTVALRRLRHAPSAAVAVMNALGSALLLAPAVALWGSFALSGRQTLTLLILGVVGFMLPYAILSRALRHITAPRASLILLIETVLNPLFTFLAVGERPPPATLIGGAIILTSLAGWLLLAGAGRKETDTTIPAKPGPDTE